MAAADRGVTPRACPAARGDPPESRGRLRGDPAGFWGAWCLVTVVTGLGVERGRRRGRKQQGW